ncbi:crAss001_48 related protein [Azomonas agilis]|nr:hypothetical protein [Azomonas agilis]
MQHYVGTKIVRMQPMSRQQYNDFRGWQLPSDENGADEGYLVEYLDGGKPNTPHFAGYISWSPKEQAEKAYLPLGDLSFIPDWQQRVVAEKAQLDDRLAKLTHFLDKGQFQAIAQALPYEDLLILEYQKRLMTELAVVLQKRIKRFSIGFGARDNTPHPAPDKGGFAVIGRPSGFASASDISQPEHQCCGKCSTADRPAAQPERQSDSVTDNPLLNPIHSLNPVSPVYESPSSYNWRTDSSSSDSSSGGSSSCD